MSATQANQPSANIRIVLSHTGQSWVVPVIPETTLRNILEQIHMDPELFNHSCANAYVFVNEGKTTMPHLDRNMIDYNNWYVDHGYISSVYIKHRNGTTEYDW